MWFKNLLCFLLGHLPQIEEAIEGLVRCERCGKVLGKAVDDDKTPPVAPPPPPPPAVPKA